MKRIIAQVKKELTQLWRDRLTLALALVLPVLLLLLLSKATSLSVRDIPVAVQDLDKTATSRMYLESVAASLSFKLIALPTDSAPEQPLLKNQARGALVIPPNFERDLLRGENAEVQWLIDATDANTANIMRGKAVAITQAFTAQIKPAQIQPAVRPQLRYWFNPGREDLKYFGPGVLAFGLALFPPLLAALALSREGELKTIMQVYVSSITAFEYLLGKVIAYAIVAWAEWVAGMLVLFFVFGLRLVGDPTPLLITTFFYLLCTTCFGTMLGAAIPNQAAAIQATQLGGFLTSFLLSGYIFPVTNIPQPLRSLSYVVPMRYYLEVIRDAFLRGGGWAGLWQAPLALALLGGFFFWRAWSVMREMQVKA
ncbi:MAG TPA: ABC transporter permease [Pyrinomonadaceae bacterium]|jgi:drug efflux transport system permease protein|nr:ABC transporter permease [Pyrinomonadaceae bacterium]